MERFRIYEVQVAEEGLVDAVVSLLSQLSASSHHFGMNELNAIVNSPSSHLFVAECSSGICGMLTLGEYLAPTGRKMWIEDVVVDEAMRGNAIGRRLVVFAQQYASSLGCGALMLTSRPSRIAANALYSSCGFSIKETNMYVMPVGNE
jgi:ribosomal protein S18 acetylase RimI-like enzyme